MLGALLAHPGFFLEGAKYDAHEALVARLLRVASRATDGTRDSMSDSSRGSSRSSSLPLGSPRRASIV